MAASHGLGWKPDLIDGTEVKLTGFGTRGVLSLTRGTKLRLYIRMRPNRTFLGRVELFA